MRFLHPIVFAFLLIIFSHQVQAHKMRPAIVNITFNESTVDLVIEANAEALIAGIGPEHDNTDDAPGAQIYRSLREMPAEQLSAEFDSFVANYITGLNLEVSGNPVVWSFQSIKVPPVGDTRLARKTEIYFSASLPSSADQARWSYSAKYGDAVVNFSTQQEDKQSYWLVDGKQSPVFNLENHNKQRNWADIGVDYMYLGFLHILPKGLDHILFVLGLFLLSLRLGPLLWQVTAFTIAHSITLALSIYGLISLPATVVEPLIALSIAYVGIENILTRDLKPWRVLVVFLFGLLHGMGFAGVLLGLGLPEQDFIPALVSFNVGVELGQISIIALAYIAVFWLWKNDVIYRRWVVYPGSLLIAITGLYWTWERIV